MNAKTSTGGLSSSGEAVGEARAEILLVACLVVVVDLRAFDLVVEDLCLERATLSGVTVAFDSFEPFELCVAFEKSDIIDGEACFFRAGGFLERVVLRVLITDAIVSVFAIYWPQKRRVEQPKVKGNRIIADRVKSM